MKGTTALAKIQKRTKQLQRAHPGKKYSTLRTQAASEYNNGRLPKARKKHATKKKARAKRRKVAKVGTHHRQRTTGSRVVSRKRNRSGTGHRAKRKPGRVVYRTKTVTKTRRVGGTGKSVVVPIAIAAGAGLLLYMLLKPKPGPVTVPGVSTPLQLTGNAVRDTASQNMLAYAQAAGAGIAALTNLIRALNSSNDNQVVTATTMVQAGQLNPSTLQVEAGYNNPFTSSDTGDNFFEA